MFYLSQALVSGFLKEIRLTCPVSFPHSIGPNLEAVRTTHEHTQDYARERRKTALQTGDPDSVRACYKFNLTLRSSAPGDPLSVMAISKMHYSRPSHPRLSLLGLPRGKTHNALVVQGDI